MNEELLITMATAVILSSVKNPQKKLALKKAMLKIYKTIQLVYAGDPDFQAGFGGGD